MGKRARDGKERRSSKRRRREAGGRSRSSTPASPPSPHRLIVEAAVGDRRAAKALLKAGADPAYADADGNTALHEACRHGHLDVIKLLLKHDAPARAVDARGNTPAHLAAQHRHLAALAMLLQARRPPDIEARNKQGVSVRQLAAAAMEGGAEPGPGSTGAGAGAGAGSQQQWQQPQAGGWGEPAAGHAVDEEGEQDGWRRRLAEELSDAEEDEAAWGRAADEYETAEEYARRIWEEMQARRRAQRDAEMAAFRRRRREEESRREWARQQAEEASRKVLEEEKKKDADWRQAVAQGQAGAKRASYEAKWQFFVGKHPEALIAYKDVPWILPSEDAGHEELQRVVLYGATTAEEKKRRLRSELIRWHPDKFTSRFGRRLVEADRQRVLERVNATSQLLNAMSAALQA